MAQIAKEYALALFSLAREAGDAAGIGEALERVRAQLEEQRDYAALLDAPSVPAEERRELCAQAFGDSVPVLLMRFLNVLIEKRRVSLLPECAEHYRKMLDIAAHVSTANVRSAAPLTDAQEARLKEKLEAMTQGIVEIHTTVDPSLIGGVVIEMDGKVIDGSIRSRLKDIKDVIGG